MVVVRSLSAASATPPLSLSSSESQFCVEMSLTRIARGMTIGRPAQGVLPCLRAKQKWQSGSKEKEEAVSPLVAENKKNFQIYLKVLEFDGKEE